MISKKQFRSYKIINGKKYRFQKATPKKHIADKEAKRLRKKGYNVRIIKQKGHYILYGLSNQRMIFSVKEVEDMRNEGWGDISLYR